MEERARADRGRPRRPTFRAVGLLLAYTAAMFILYTVAPILYRMASSAYYNLSLLSSDFYGLLFGLFLFVRAPRSLAPRAPRTWRAR